MESTRIVPRGVVAGLVGAAVMAAWFLAVDLARGVPFGTPAFVAGALLGGDGEVAAAPVALYTLIHFLAFMVVGTLLSAMLRWVPVNAPVLLGAVAGFLLFDAVFYGSILATGANVVNELGWPQVLIGNVLAGVALMLTLHGAGATATGPTWAKNLLAAPVVREGVVVGLAGAAVVALWFLVLDAATGEVLRTPAALGSFVFLGAESPADIEVSARTVLGYTVLHAALWIAVGLIAAALASAAERTPPLLLAAGLLFVIFEAFFMGVVALASEFLLGTLAWWSIGAGNLLAAFVMGRMLWRAHPELAKQTAGDRLMATG
jgi:hypothetical protein